MNATGITSNCQNLYERGEHICFGISPFNSYFSVEKIEELANWGLRHFKSMHFFVPDTPSALTLQAMGYEPKKAAKKAKSQGFYLCNKIKRALSNTGFDTTATTEMILNWNALSENRRYKELHNKVKELYSSNRLFEKACLGASKWVLDQKVKDNSISEEALNLAVQYFLAEIPLFINTPEIINTKSSVFSYHQCIPVIAGLYQQELPLKAESNQGFLLLRNEVD